MTKRSASSASKASKKADQQANDTRLNLTPFYAFVAAQRTRLGRDAAPHELMPAYKALDEKELRKINDAAIDAQRAYAAKLEKKLDDDPGALDSLEAAEDEELGLELPFARVRRIATMHSEAKSINKDAVFVVAKATEAFLAHRVIDANRVTNRTSRSTIFVKDIVQGLMENENAEKFQYFIDELQPPKPQEDKPKVKKRRYSRYEKPDFNAPP